MMAFEERIYLVGATGNIGKPLVQKLLVNPKVALTLYTRKTSKVQEIFGAEHPEGKVTIVEGDYDNQKPFADSIAGHRRLFLLAQPPNFTDYQTIPRRFAETAYGAGVEQIVIISSTGAPLPWRVNLYGMASRQFEEAVLNIPNRKALVTLRPGFFMTNQLWGDLFTIKGANKIVDMREEDQTRPWISPKDIGELAANVLQDPIEKHGDAVYELVGDPRTPLEQAESLSRVLGKTITYEKLDEEQTYQMFTQQAGMSHLTAILRMQLTELSRHQKSTIGLSVLLGRDPQTLEQWIEENKAAFL
ncbi:hypothetical protein BDA99DRAFT_511171 [Phascolomyces articulosus]|uniref:NAD(P)-binding domain-containing protein n=1 Tax=Phascolomyces articulosus TaxID=60185 RepID=A0AAD5K9P0_9FUNG|nr:hypothetical protein BDA99DRAFT_511171 [Phascolomyces articulosus]